MVEVGGVSPLRKASTVGMWYRIRLPTLVKGIPMSWVQRSLLKKSTDRPVCAAMPRTFVQVCGSSFFVCLLDIVKPLS